MKKLFLFFFVLACCNITVNADKEPVIIVIRVDERHGEDCETPRSPIRRPSLFIEDYTLSFTNSCVGYTLQLVQNDVIVYNYNIDSTDDLVLPDDLTGIYEIRLVGGSFTFVGEIEL